MTNLILPRRKLLIPSFAAGLAAATPAAAMGHNGGPPMATEADVSRVVEQAKGAGILAPWGTLPSDPSLAMFVLAKFAMTRVGSSEAGPNAATVFNQQIYTGNSASRSITTGMAPDFVMTKMFAGATGPVISYDKNKGPQYYFRWDDTNSETFASTSLTAFNVDGFSLGSGNESNAGSIDYAFHAFKKSPAFFDIVDFTTTSDSNRRLSHALGVPPGLIILKRTNTNSNFYIYHISYGINGYGTIPTNFSNASGFWGTSDPTNTDFGLGEASWFSSGYLMRAYVFGHDTGPNGLIQCGSYTGNGSSSGPTITLGWEPQLVFIKAASSGVGASFLAYADIYDATNPRNVVNKMEGSSFATSGYDIDFLSTGFQVVSSFYEVNNSGAVYNYMAVRKSAP